MKSILMRSRIWEEMKESWLKQATERMPWRMSSRCLEGAALKTLQTCYLCTH